MNHRRVGKVPQGWIARAGRLLGAGAQVLRKEVAMTVRRGLAASETVKLLDTRVSQAAEIVAALGDLKGAAMKAGQLLSLELSDLLPPEVTDVLRTLHDSSSFMPFEQVQKILQRELGTERLQHFRNLSTEPIAAASIGQVHSADLDGRPVVLKVQYPGVAKSIDSDLAVLKRLVQGFLLIQGKQVAIDELFREIAEGLKEESDYKLEAQALNRYRQALADEPDFVMPEALEEYSTRRVLALTFMQGERLSSWLQQQQDEETTQRFALLILRLLLVEFFQVGMVQTDPNYGNFLIEPNARRLVLLDFGATRTYPKAFRRDFRALLQAAYGRDDAKVLACAEKFFLLDPREAPEVKAQFLQMIELIVGMFRPENQPFDFSNQQYLQDIRAVAFAFIGAVQYTAPARKLVFLNRKLGGMFHLLKDAGVSADLSPFWDIMCEMKI